MGASGWSYFTPYQPDIDAALQALRAQVFAEGHYYRPAEFYAALLQSQALPAGPRARVASHVAELQARPAPATLAELIEQNAEDGTHSIIDIDRITTTPAFGAASPLMLDDLIALCGTTTPTRANVQPQTIFEKYRVPGWQGRYFIVYAKGQPSEIFFWGFSGD